MTGTNIETRLTGRPASRYWQELFRNSGQFPVANILLELLLEGPREYLFGPDMYAMLLAALVQAYWLSRWQAGPAPRRFLGNLVGPGLYTLIESSIEGMAFFYAPHHLAYWGFALAVGALQSLRPRLPGTFGAFLLILEDVVRAMILFVMYAIFETSIDPNRAFSLREFLDESSHQFIALATLLLGVSVGLANVVAEGYLGLLRQTSAQLRIYSEWLLGRDLLGRVIADPEALLLARRERTVLFADIRGFTRWSEARPPEEVVAMLNQYYRTAEAVFARFRTIKHKFSADEVMAIFPRADHAAAAALELRERTEPLLAERHLGLGLGLHAGPVVEGLLGGVDVKSYDVIGDTVNTAKRIESAAGAGEALISESVLGLLESAFPVGAQRRIAVKGKEAPLIIYPLLPHPGRQVLDGAAASESSASLPV